MFSLLNSIYNKFKTLSFFLKKKRVIAQYKLFEGDEWLEVSVDSIANYVDKILFVISDVSWGNAPIIQNKSIYETIERLKKKYPNKIIIFKGTWDNQQSQVQAGLDFIRKELPQITHCLYIDSDEIYDSEQIKKIISFTKKTAYFNRELRVSMKTYFKSVNYLVYPDVSFKPMALFPIRSYIKFNGIRNGVTSFKNVDVFFHHLSFVRDDEQKIKNKFITHQFDEKLCNTEDWYNKYWVNFTTNITNFHPSNKPEEFASIKKLNEEEIPFEIMKKYKEFTK